MAHKQVELNRCAFLHDGAIEAQCVAREPMDNGLLVYIVRGVTDVTCTYNTPDGTEEIVVKAVPGFVTKELKEGEKEGAILGINYTSEHIYDERTPGLKNFYVNGGEYPRVGILKAGDIFTTTAYTEAPDGFKLLEDEGCTMPDGEKAVKLMYVG